MFPTYGFNYPTIFFSSRSYYYISPQWFYILICAHATIMPYIRPYIHIYIYVFQISNWYTPDSVSLALLARQLLLLSILSSKKQFLWSYTMFTFLPPFEYLNFNSGFKSLNLKIFCVPKLSSRSSIIMK